MKNIIQVAEFPQATAWTPVESLVALARIAQRTDFDWLVVQSETDSDACREDLDFGVSAFAGEVVSLTRDDPRGWFWNHASSRTAAALGIPSGPLLVRREACVELDATPFPEVEPQLSLLPALAERDASCTAPYAQPVEACLFTERSPIPHAQDPRGGAPWTQWLRTLDAATLVPRVTSRTEATALLAGVWLLNDRLDESHSLSQSIEGAGRGHGDYWHAIMHRREPDFGNAKYWFRQVGRHSVMSKLGVIAEGLRNEIADSTVIDWCRQLTSGDWETVDRYALQKQVTRVSGLLFNWNAVATVDLAQHITQSRTVSDELRAFAERLQWAEMLLLLEASCRDAAG